MSKKTAAKKAPVFLSKDVKKNTSKTNTVEQTRKKLPGFSINADANKDANKGDVMPSSSPSMQNNAAPDKKEFSIQSGSSIKRLRITSSSDATSDGVKVNTPATLAPGTIRAPKRAEAANMSYEGEPVLMLSPQNTVPMKRSPMYRAMHIFVSVTSAIWFGLVFGYIHTQIGWGNFIAMEPPMLGGFVAGILAPVAFLWMFLAYAQRGADIQMYADNLRAELQSMLFPTEERAQVIHKDIEELCKQAAELSAASKSVLRSIHRARMGLRNEVNDFTGITKKTEFHIDRLSETLNQRSGKLLEIATEIETRTDAIGEKSEGGVKAWDDASRKILSKSQEMEGALTQGTEKLLDAANEVDSKTAAIKDKMASSYSGFNDAIESMSGKIDNFDGMLESMKTIGDSIQDNRDAMDVAAQELHDQASNIADKLNGGIDKVEGAIARMNKDTEGFEDALTQKIDDIQGAVSGFQSKIDSIEGVGQDTAKTIDQALSVAITGTQTVHSNIRNSVDAIHKASEVANDHANKLAQQAEAQIQALSAKSNERAEDVAKTLQLIEESTKRVEELSQNSDAKVSGLVEALDAQIEKMNLAKSRLTGGLDDLGEVFDAPLCKIRDNVERVSQTQLELEQRLAKQIDTLNNAANRNNTAAQDVSETLRKHAQDISSMTGQIAGHTKSVNEEMDQQKTKIHSFVQLAESDIKRLSNLADEKVKALSETTTLSGQTMNDVANAIAQSQKTLMQDTHKTNEELTALNLSIENVSARICTASLQSSTAMAEARKEAQAASDMIKPVYEDIVHKADAAQTRIKALKADMDIAGETSVESLNNAGRIFDERLEALSAGSKDAANLLNVTSDVMKERVEDIEKASITAEGSMRKIEQTLDGQASDMHLATDQAVLKIEAVQKAVNSQFYELTEQVSQAVVEIENTGKALSVQKDQIKQTTQSVCADINIVSTKIRDENGSLANTIKQTADMTDSLVDHIRKETTSLITISQSGLKDLKHIGEDLAMRTHEFDTHIKATTTTSQHYAKALEEQVQSIAKSSTMAADKVSDAIGVVSTQMDRVSADTKMLLTDIGLSQKALSEQTDVLMTTSKGAVENVANASSDLGRQSTALFKAAQDADQTIEKIRQSEWHAQRDAFMGSAKFIVESLHSLSVDITRVIEKSLPEKAWKAYQNGDVSVFTARLAAMGGKFPMKEVQHKYDDDSDFRSYVNRFMRQFEEVYAQADKNDHGALLVSTFASSDIGKLYERLCTATGHKSKAQGIKKAA